MCLVASVVLLTSLGIVTLRTWFSNSSPVSMDPLPTKMPTSTLRTRSKQIIPTTDVTLMKSLTYIEPVCHQSPEENHPDPLHSWKTLRPVHRSTILPCSPRLDLCRCDCIRLHVPQLNKSWGEGRMLCSPGSSSCACKSYTYFDDSWLNHSSVLQGLCGAPPVGMAVQTAEISLPATEYGSTYQTLASSSPKWGHSLGLVSAPTPPFCVDKLNGIFVTNGFNRSYGVSLSQVVLCLRISRQ